MRDDRTINPIAICYTWGGEQPCGILRRDRRHHVYVVGKTGCGKSTLLRNLILQDILDGEGVGVVDPHGDLAEELLDLIPAWRSDDVLYFNPADTEYPVGFNVFSGVRTESRHLVASGLVSAFKGIWRDSWGPRLEYILHAAALALLECENVSLLGIQRMLVDDRYRSWVVKQVEDPIVRAFWLREFARYDERFLREAIAPIQNKVGQLLMAPIMRNILGQVRSSFDTRWLMDHGRIFIANLAKGKLGEEKANLLGSLLTTQFQLAALSRADVPEGERRPFYLAADEFHNFTTDSFGGILAEARKYGLCLTLCHQYTGQLAPEVRDAVFGNVGTLVAFGVSAADAEILEAEFSNAFPASMFVDLARYDVLMKVATGGAPSFRHARTLPPLPHFFGRRENLIQLSREKYATPRAAVEAKIGRWLGR